MIDFKITLASLLSSRVYIQSSKPTKLRKKKSIQFVQRFAFSFSPLFFFSFFSFSQSFFRIFKDLFPQSQPQQTRHEAISILNSLLKKYTDGIKKKKKTPKLKNTKITNTKINKKLVIKEFDHDFVFGYIQTIDSERDPRNLMLIFETTEYIVKNLKGFTRFTEDLFDVTSCYYPVNFTPKENDLITKEMLSNALKNALTSTPFFAPHLFPFLLEKLSGSLLDAKIETLHTICHSIFCFDPSHFAPFSLELWNSLRDEIFTSTEPLLIQEATDSIFRITKRL